jgi:hypothetical protein
MSGVTGPTGTLTYASSLSSTSDGGYYQTGGSVLSLILFTRFTLSDSITTDNTGAYNFIIPIGTYYITYSVQYYNNDGSSNDDIKFVIKNSNTTLLTQYATNINPHSFGTTFMSVIVNGPASIGLFAMSSTSIYFSFNNTSYVNIIRIA